MPIHITVSIKKRFVLLSTFKDQYHIMMVLVIILK
jgi:hypothetical protein